MGLVARTPVFGGLPTTLALLRSLISAFVIRFLENFINLKDFKNAPPAYITGGKPRNYHEIVLTQICSQATSGTRRGSFQAENWIKKGWCHVHFCFILQLRTNSGEIRQCSSV